MLSFQQYDIMDNTWFHVGNIMLLLVTLTLSLGNTWHYWGTLCYNMTLLVITLDVPYPRTNINKLKPYTFIDQGMHEWDVVVRLISFE
jgi:hypothetical protein